MNSLEEWDTFTIEQVNDILADTTNMMLTTVVKLLDQRRGYLDNPEFIIKAFNVSIENDESNNNLSLFNRR